VFSSLVQTGLPLRVVTPATFFADPAIILRP
jgi:hypothetical protein